MWEIEENTTGAVGYAYGTPVLSPSDWKPAPKVCELK